ncbi:chromosome partitioning protein [Clostridium beijerinckii]|uniref:ParA family protein n=1 Tax=Clostridium beijerinckii TaxID=1520 RepID=UPI001494E2AE|nr:ParA family protein [Clostridium beijerinckii]NOW87955.1 chromosome partitioning protein [Clostridium beijerinckii]
MCVVISVINVKGGVGKTTSTINLAGQFAEQQHRVLLIDNDSQSNLSQILNVASEFNLYDLYSNHKINFDDCITKYNEQIDIIPNSIESAVLENELHNKMTRETILKNKFEKFKKKDNYDVIIIDNSPFMGLCTTNALSMSNFYIEIIDNSTSSLQGLNLVQKLITNMKDDGINSDIKLLGILRNNFDKKTLFSRQINEVVSEEFEKDIFKTIIYNSVKYKEAATCNKTIQEYSKKYASAYKDLYYEIIKRLK